MSLINEIKDLIARVENAKGFDGKEGRWITVKGTRVFIPDGRDEGEVVAETFGEKGKSKEGKKERKKIIYKKDKDYDGSIVGIFEDEHGEFQALTPTVSKTFKTIKGAERFLESRGFKRPNSTNNELAETFCEALAEVLTD